MWRPGWGILAVLFLAGCVPPDGVPQGPSGPFAGRGKADVPSEARAVYRYLRARMDVLAGDSRAAHEHFESAREHDPSSVFLRTRLARSHLALGEADAAVAEAEAAVSLDAGDPESRRLLAGLYSATGRAAESVRQYRKVLELDPDDAQARLYLGAIHLAEGQYREARKYLERYTQDNPASPLGHYYLGRTLAESRDFARAEESYAAALELLPTSAPVLTEMGLVREFRGRENAASETYRKLMEVDPRNEWAGPRLRALRMGLGRLPEARAEFARMGSREAAPGVTRMKVGIAHYEVGNLEAAVTELSLALVERPGDHRVRFFLGLAHERLGDGERAAAQFEGIPRDSDYFVDSRVRLASVHEGRERFAEAAAALRAALEALEEDPDPRDPDRRKDLLRFLAEVYRRAKDYPNAIEVMLTVVDQDPGNARLRFALGALYDEGKDKDKTIEQMRKAIELEPEYDEALNYLGYTYADMDVELDRAEQLILRALELEPNDGFYIDSLGWVYYRKGDYRRAIEQLEKAVRLVVDDPVIIEHLGDAYLEDGRPDEALRSYRRALESADEDEQMERIRSKIGDIEHRT